MIDYPLVFSWLNEFKAKAYDHANLIHAGLVEDKSSELGPAADGLFEKIKGLVRLDGMKEAGLVLEQFKKLAGKSQNSMERGEIWVKCSWACLALQEWGNAEKALRKASAEYPASSHQQAISLWLLGYVQWRFTGVYPEAFENVSRAIIVFEELHRFAQMDHLEARAVWYAEKIELMNEALKNMVSTSFFDSAASLP